MNRLSQIYSVITPYILAITLFAGIQSQALADDSHLKGNKVQFSITESQNVPNDSISMTFNRVAEGVSPQAVANEINLQMQAAINALKPHPDIIVQTSQYNINPVYNKQVITHWRGQQSLVLTLENKPGLVKVLAKIQPYLAYQSMQFGVSDTLQRQILAQLTDKAILQFRNQANRIAQGFQVPSFKILETNINMPSFSPARSMYARADVAMLSKEMAAPTVSAGQSKLQVTISGTILLPY